MIADNAATVHLTRTSWLTTARIRSALNSDAGQPSCNALIGDRNPTVQTLMHNRGTNLSIEHSELWLPLMDALQCPAVHPSRTLQHDQHQPAM